PISSLPLPSPANVYRITVDQYDRMVESGVLAEDDPVELLGGGPWYARCRNTRVTFSRPRRHAIDLSRSSPRAGTSARKGRCGFRHSTNPSPTWPWPVATAGPTESITPVPRTSPLWLKLPRPKAP